MQFYYTESRESNSVNVMLQNGYTRIKILFTGPWMYSKDSAIFHQKMSLNDQVTCLNLDKLFSSIGCNAKK